MRLFQYRQSAGLDMKLLLNLLVGRLNVKFYSILRLLVARGLKHKTRLFVVL